jgi:ubiquinone/menaquinone biosynthesis C-methylase UbiE
VTGWPGVEHMPRLYDACCALYERLGLMRWRRWLVVGARGLTLDVGCGTGRNLPLFPAGARPVGLDPDHALLRRARWRAPRAPLVQARAEALPFRDGTFDTVVSGLAFCSIADPARGLGEVRRVLAADGRLRMLEHVRSRVPWRARWQDRWQPWWTWISGGCHPNRETERTVETAGFAIEPDGRGARGDLRRFAARPARPGHVGGLG